VNLVDMPQLVIEQWPPANDPAWDIAESLLGTGYHFKCHSACQLEKVEYRPGWLFKKTGKTASELGVPVHQALFVAVMRQREGYCTDPRAADGGEQHG